MGRVASLALLCLLLIGGRASAAPGTGAGSGPVPRPGAPEERPTASASPESTPTGPATPLAAPEPPEPLPEPPVQGYKSKGIYSRFCFGLGVHIGVNAITAKKPLLGGISAHFRASGIVGIALEYDFNRVGEEPSPLQLLSSAKYIHFIPNLRVAAIIVPYRWRMLGPFVLLGMGFDTGATQDERSTNIQFGLGLEGTFWKHRLAVVGEVRAFMPLPGDVERHRERVQISGGTADTGTTKYYNLKNLLFTLSLRYYY